MKKLLNLVCLSLGVLSGVDVAAQTRPNCSIQETYYLKREGGRIVLNPANPEAGQTSVATHAISQTRGGPKVGVTVTRRTNLGLESLTPGPDGMYEMATTAYLPDGVLVIFSVADADKDKYAHLVERPVVGGSGKYAGARGTTTAEPLKDSDTVEMKLTVDVDVFCKKP